MNKLSKLFVDNDTIEKVGEDVVEAAGLVPGPARGLQLLHPPPGGLAEHQPGLGLVIELVAVNV